MSIETLSSRRGVGGGHSHRGGYEVEIAVGDAEAAAAEVEVTTTLSEMSGQRSGAEPTRRGGEAAARVARGSSSVQPFGSAVGLFLTWASKGFLGRASPGEMAEKWLQPFWIADSALSISIGYEKSDD
jgi:hypothetical protein